MRLVRRTTEHAVWETVTARDRAFAVQARATSITDTPIYALGPEPGLVRFDRDSPDEVVLSVVIDAPATVVLADA
jgi:hypothetical protein